MAINVWHPPMTRVWQWKQVKIVEVLGWDVVYMLGKFRI